MVAADWSGDDGSLLLFTKSNAFSGHFSTYIYNISKCKDYAAKKTTSHRCFVDDREVLTLLIHTGTGILGCKVPALANLLVQGGRISLYIPPFGSVWLQYNMSYGFIQTI